MAGLPIRKFMDLSTGHLQEATCRYLDTYVGVSAHSTKYGWLVYATLRAEEFAEVHRWPDELLPIMQLARANGCDYILFDQDGPTVDELPTWEW